MLWEPHNLPSTLLLPPVFWWHFIASRNFILFFGLKHTQGKFLMRIQYNRQASWSFLVFKIEGIKNQVLKLSGTWVVSYNFTLSSCWKWLAYTFDIWKKKQSLHCLTPWQILLLARICLGHRLETYQEHVIFNRMEDTITVLKPLQFFSLQSPAKIGVFFVCFVIVVVVVFPS